MRTTLTAAFGLSLTVASCAQPVDEIPERQKQMFLTSSTYQGDLVRIGQAEDGLTSADKLCVTAAIGAELGSKRWKAWLSSSTVDAIDRIEDKGPWYSTGGDRVFNNRANLATEPLGELGYDEFGGEILGDTTFWTGTDTGGVRAAGGPSATCNDWTYAEGSSPPEGAVANATFSTTSWYDLGSACDWSARLLCIEQ